MNSSVSDVLKGARNLVAQGWCHNVGKIFGTDRNTTHYCSVIAIDECDKRTKTMGLEDQLMEDFCEAVCQAAGVVRKEYKLTYNTAKYSWVDTLIGWNDEPGRTQAEVLAAFDRAILMAEIGQELPTLQETVKEEEHELATV